MIFYGVPQIIINKATDLLVLKDTEFFHLRNSQPDHIYTSPSRKPRHQHVSLIQTLTVSYPPLHMPAPPRVLTPRDIACILFIGARFSFVRCDAVSKNENSAQVYFSVCHFILYRLNQTLISCTDNAVNFTLGLQPTCFERKQRDFGMSSLTNP